MKYIAYGSNMSQEQMAFRCPEARLVGTGYIEIVRKMIEEKELKLIVFDLTNVRPAQIRNLEEKLKCRVIGRNEVILDIFARRARSAETAR